MSCYLDTIGLRFIAYKLEELKKEGVVNATITYEGETIKVVTTSTGRLAVRAE